MQGGGKTGKKKRCEIKRKRDMKIDIWLGYEIKGY